MTNEEKAAILILSLEEEIAANVVKNLTASEMRRVGRCMNRLNKITDEEMGYAASEFCKLAQEKGKRIVQIEDNLIKNIIIRAVGEEKAEEILRIIEEDKFRPYDNPIIDKLRDIDPKVLMDFTKMEHPQTIALILAHLRPEQSAEILEGLPNEKQREIVKRIATLKSVPHEFIEEMVRALESELTLSGTSEQQFGGVRMMAEILNKMSQSSEQAILESLDEDSQGLAGEIKNLMFTFDDIFQLDDRGLRELLQEVTNEDLGRSLKVADSSLREKVFNNMSKRAAEMLKEDIELMPPTRLSEVEQSQRIIIDIAKRLESEGKVQFSRNSAEGDEFV